MTAKFSRTPVPPELCGKPPQAIVPQLRRTDNLIFRQINQIGPDNGVEEITAPHGWILRYLYDNRDHSIYQRDIERAFSITRSTVTNILQLMEKKGYIRRESVPDDARLKRLVLTPEGVAAHERMHRSFRELNGIVEGLLTPAENAELLRLLDKLQAGLSADMADKRAPEEPAQEPAPAGADREGE